MSPDGLTRTLVTKRRRCHYVLLIYVYVDSRCSTFDVTEDATDVITPIVISSSGSSRCPTETDSMASSQPGTPLPGTPLSGTSRSGTPAGPRLSAAGGGAGGLPKKQYQKAGLFSSCYKNEQE